MTAPYVMMNEAYDIMDVSSSIMKAYNSSVKASGSVMKDYYNIMKASYSIVGASYNIMKNPTFPPKNTQHAPWASYYYSDGRGHIKAGQRVPLLCPHIWGVPRASYFVVLVQQNP